MKIKRSIFTILFAIFFIAFLISENYFYKRSQYFHTVSAKETATNKHNIISDAFILSVNQTYKKSLSPYDTFYGYFNSSQNIKLCIYSHAVQSLKVTLLSDSGKEISSHHSLSGNRCILTLPPKNNTTSKRIFFKIYNHSANNTSFQIKLQKSNSSNHNLQKRNTNKSNSLKKKSSITANTIQPTSNPKKSFSTKKKLSTKAAEKVVLNPQFLLLKPNSTHKYNLKAGKTNCNFSDYTIINSNSSIATVKSNKIHALKEGITIIYLQNKQNPAITYSCLIRVLNDF